MERDKAVPGTASGPTEGGEYANARNQSVLWYPGDYVHDLRMLSASTASTRLSEEGGQHGLYSEGGPGRGR